jgi:hypothetical protein
MDTPPTTTNQLRLSTAEMAFMLAWLEVPRLIGGDNAALFPVDPQQRDALRAQGKAELEAAGLITWDDTYRTYHPNEALVALSIGVAVPELVVIGNTQTPDGVTGGITYAFTGNLIVELTLQGETYVLRPIAAAAVVAECLVYALEIPDAAAQTETYLIPQPVFQALRQQQPLPSAAAIPPSLSAALTHPARTSFVVLLKLAQGNAQTISELGIITAQECTTWLITPQPPDQILIQLTNAATFTELLTAAISVHQPSAT